LRISDPGRIVDQKRIALDARLRHALKRRLPSSALDKTSGLADYFGEKHAAYAHKCRHKNRDRRTNVSRFLVTYHGSGMPSDPAQAQQARAAFGDWVGKAGQALVDPGAPLKPGTRVANGQPAPQVAFGGYSVIEAPSLDAAVELLNSHPYVARGGTLQVDEAMAV
jgi:hypothetical protein